MVSEMNDLLEEFENYIVGEVILPINHYLVGTENTTLEKNLCIAACEYAPSVPWNTTREFFQSNSSTPKNGSLPSAPFLVSN